MLPSRQRLYPGYDAGSDIDLRLIVDHKLIAIEGPPQVFVGNGDAFLVLLAGRLFRPDVGEQQLLQLSDGKGLLEVPDHVETQRLRQFLGRLDDANVNSAH